jgi:hypothetical protein
MQNDAPDKANVIALPLFIDADGADAAVGFPAGDCKHRFPKVLNCLPMTIVIFDLHSHRIEDAVECSLLDKR